MINSMRPDAELVKENYAIKKSMESNLLYMQIVPSKIAFEKGTFEFSAIPKNGIANSTRVFSFFF